MRKLLFLILCIAFIKVNAQVDLQTGNSTYYIPILEHMDQKSGLGTAVSISYNSGGGIKVNEISSEIGIRWNMNAGGIIQRFQKNVPDDQYLFTNYSSLAADAQLFERDDQNLFANYYPNGYLFQQYAINDLPIENAVMPRFTNGTASIDYMQSPRGQSDKEQDIFILSLPTVNCKFILEPNATKFTVLSGDKIKIDYQYFDDNFMLQNNIQTRIKSFTVTDINGLIYQFDDYELDNIGKIQNDYTEPHLAFTVIDFSINSTVITPKVVVNTWKLTSITNPFNSKQITFTYGLRTYTYMSNVLPQYNEYVPSAATNQQVNSVSILKYNSFGNKKILSQIIFPDQYRIKFYNDIDTRYDINDGTGRVAKITLIDQVGTEKKLVEFDHQYFYKGGLRTFMLSDNSYVNKKYMKMCLDEVVFDRVYRYKFEYNNFATINNTNYGVPPLNSIAQDAWGYYLPNANINDDTEDYFSYKSGIYNFLIGNPTLTRNPSNGFAQVGLLKKIILPTGGNIEYEYEQNKVLNNGMETFSGGVRVKKVFSNDNGFNPVIVSNYSYTLANSSSSGWGYDELNNYTVKDLVHQKDVPITLTSWPRGGVLVKKLEYKNLKAVYSLAASISSYAIPVYGQWKFVLDLSVNMIAYWIKPTTDYQLKSWDINCTFRNNPLGQHYSRVEVTSTNSNYGKAIFIFSAPTQSSILPNVTPFANFQRFDEWKYGLPLQTSYYDNNGNVVKQIDNSFIETNVLINNINANFSVNKYFSNRYDFPVFNASQVSSTDFDSKIYYNKKGYSQTLTTSEKTYGKNGRVSEVKTYYDYTGSTNLQPREIYSFNSKGEKVGTTVYYSSDYNITTGAMAELKYKNILTLPITTLSWYIPVGATTKMYTGIATNEYTITTNGEVKILKSYKDYNNTPVAVTSVGAFSPASIFITYPNVQVVTELGYNATGDLVNTKTEGDQKIATIYDYDGKYAVATVVNAIESDIAYSSFETASTGNWVIQNPEYADNKFSPTGIRHLKMNDNSTIITKTGLNAATTYLISYWSRRGALNIHNTFPTPAVTINGWSLYIHEIQGRTDLSINTVASPGSTDFNEVDELRLYPKNSRMATTVIDPTFGKIAECDPNNYIMYYKYDKLGRLIVIQDQYRNATKIFDYNVKTN
jgi:hypothetical protein